MSATVLYTPAVLALATALAAHPWDDSLPLKGEARSKSCGSELALGLALDAEGRISSIGLRTRACAVGQAAAAIFAGAAAGMTPAQVAAGEAAIASWLAGGGPVPDWPGLDAIAAAQAYPARHGAILLPWRAAHAALATDAAAS